MWCERCEIIITRFRRFGRHKERETEKEEVCEAGSGVEEFRVIFERFLRKSEVRGGGEV
jgi:GrpB-like predicted nucleotidyltransferase (UPF0157 family)